MGKTGLGAIVCKTAHVRFCRRKWVLTRLCSKNRKQGHTRQNRGCFGWGWYHYPRRVPHVHEHPRAGCQNGVLCRFWVLVGCAPEERREPRNSDALMRVAVPRRRGPAGLRDLFLLLPKLRLLRSAHTGPFRVCEAGVVSLPSARFARCRNAGRPLVKVVYLPFSCVPYAVSGRGDGFCHPRGAG